MLPLRLVHSQVEVEVELHDEDIACEEPAAEMRPSVQVSYDRLNAFLGQYLSQMRRGEPLMLAAPLELVVGAVVDVEIIIEELDSFVLHAQVLARWPLPDSDLAEVQFVAGPMTDRIVAPIVESALGARLAARLLRPPVLH